MTTAEKHRLRIARATLRMNDPMAAVMGGMSKAEAREAIRGNGGSYRQVTVTVPGTDYVGTAWRFDREKTRTVAHAQAMGTFAGFGKR